MSYSDLDSAALGNVGMMRQKQEDWYVMRLKAVAGDLDASQLVRIAEVAVQYGRGSVHLSARQGVEIHYVHKDNLEKARAALAEAGVEMGACGPRVRVIVACPGASTCRWGIIDTKELARELDARYFKQEMPSKFKFAVTGCPNNCTKANENDIGIRGAIEPRWEEALCLDCGLCPSFCPVGAIVRREDERSYRYEVTQEQCLNCAVCSSLCPAGAWVAGRKGYTVLIGGTMGKKPRFASVLKKIVEDRRELHALIAAAVAVYREKGLKKERFGHTIDRIGLETIREDIFARAADYRQEP